MIKGLLMPVPLTLIPAPGAPEEQEACQDEYERPKIHIRFVAAD